MRNGFSEGSFTPNRIQYSPRISANGMPTRDARKLISEPVELVKKFLPCVLVEIRDSKNTVAFKTPMEAKKPPY